MYVCFGKVWVLRLYYPSVGLRADRSVLFTEVLSILLGRGGVPINLVTASLLCQVSEVHCWEYPADHLHQRTEEGAGE